RGATPKKQLRGWFAALEQEIVQVDVEGQAALARRADLDELVATEPDTDRVHLLPAFDQYVLGPGTSDPAILAPERRALVSRPGGWISPIVLLDGRVAGTWETINDEPRVSPFPEVKLPRDELSAAVQRMGAILASVSASAPASAG
ncbi:MAG TPA: crosslink repair DNA glycosylase YcaQ family protein, partial [Solirubrobacteraceae bacterium]|nr:crosslink repair DNA glycosylase YcaQ family protein [Solirubrobacteraceae bacterium]